MSNTPIFDKLNQPEPAEPDRTPRPKVVAATVGAGVGSAVAEIIVWVTETAAHIDIPESVEFAVGVVITAGLAFVAGYWKSDNRG